MIKDKIIIADGKQNDVLNNKNINKLVDIQINLVKEDDCWNILENLNNNN